MKKLLLAGTATLLLSTPANAIVIDTGGDITNYACAITKSKTLPGETPITSIIVTVTYEEPPSFGVVHVDITGKEYDRSEQYTNVRDTERKGKFTWSGTSRRNSRYRMVGTFTFPEDVQTGTYVERFYKNGKLNSETRAACHIIETRP